MVLFVSLLVSDVVDYAVGFVIC